jgi:hypothetical protein
MRIHNDLQAHGLTLSADPSSSLATLRGRWRPLVCLLLGIGLVIAAWLPVPARAFDIERKPINYNTAPADNAITRLEQRLDKGRATLAHEKGFGYLRSLLSELQVPQSSQMLVFSKTSLQRHRITPEKPRAIYFNDDVYVGFCQQGDVLEITAVDPQLGAVFYSLDQKPAEKPRFVRQTESCLLCHGSSQNQGFPGHLARSVYSDGDGNPILSSGTYRIDQTSPLKQRWGGWYVSGTSGKQTHLGNLIVRDRQPPEQIDNAAGLNVTDLSRCCQTASYLTPHSDIVALMVLEHQTEMHNRITRANFLTRIALYEEADLNKAFGRPANFRSESTVSRIRSAGEPLVKYLLFSGEAPLTERIQGTSSFAREFVQAGPRDRRGRSLRDLDLEHRLVKYPCSYLIYSAAFEGLPGPVKDYVLQRLWDILNGRDTTTAFAHLTAADRRSILDILLETKPTLPEYWRSGDMRTEPPIRK